MFLSNFPLTDVVSLFELLFAMPLVVSLFLQILSLLLPIFALFQTIQMLGTLMYARVRSCTVKLHYVG